jgi:hypothetical protein
MKNISLFLINLYFSEYIQNGIILYIYANNKKYKHKLRLL